MELIGEPEGVTATDVLLEPHVNSGHMTITAAQNATHSDTSSTVRFSSGPHSESVPLRIVVHAPAVTDGGSDAAVASFTLTVDPSNVELRPDAGVTLQVTAGREGGLTDAMALSVSGVPTEVSATVTSIPAGANSGAVQLISAPSSPHGTFTITVIGSSRGIQRNATATVLVRGRPGDLDRTFGDAGIVNPFATTANWAEPHDVLIQPDGKILAVGWAGGDVALARVDSRGHPDPTFGTQGEAVISIVPGDGDMARAVRITADRGLVIAGWAENVGVRATISRIDNAGARVSSFGTNGTVLIDFRDGGTSGDAYSLAVQSSGHILVAGEVSSGYFGVARVNAATGALDPTFGNGGVVLGFGGSNSAMGARDIARFTDDSFVIVGWEVFGTDRGVFVARFGPNGQPDTLFGNQGRLLVYGTGGNVGWPAPGIAVAVQTDGKIVICASPQNHLTLRRLHPDGTIDGTFNLSSLADRPRQCDAIAIQPDGSIVVVGSVGASGGDQDATILRFFRSGSLDPTFGTGGVVTLPFSAGFDHLSGVALQPDGRMIVVGWTDRGSATRMIIARIWH